MKTTRTHPGTNRNAGFTLAELVVAVGLVALLTFAIGRLFATITRLTGTGTAVAETDALARDLETLLRRDFAGLNRMPEDDVFMVIRNSRLGGDLNLNSANGLAGADPAEGERDLYYNQNDQLADQRADILPYEQNSRAVSVRMDEIIFPTLGGSTGGIDSYQQDALGNAPVSAVFALVNYGHVLRRNIDDAYDPTDPNSFPRPIWRADGAQNFDIRSGFGAEGFRNQYAGDFILGRQQMILAGGLASGYPIGSNREAPIGNSREYTPYPRDYESAAYFDNRQRDFEIDPDDPFGGSVRDDLPNPRARWMGRTDIIAMDIDGIKRWLQGEEDLPANDMGYLPNINYPEFATNPNFVFIPADATPFDTGALDLNRRSLGPGLPDYRLWHRFKGDNNALPLSSEEAYLSNVRNLQSALAGTLSRVLVEPEPFPARRTDPSGDSDPIESRMDVSAILGERCSSFEVAWSDGSTWLFDETVRIDTDGIVDTGDETTVERVLRRGDVIWFDMDFTRQDLWNVIRGNTRATENLAGGNLPFIANNSDYNDDSGQFSPRDLDVAAALYEQPSPDPEIGDRFGLPSTLPLQYRDANGVLQSVLDENGDPAAGRERRLNGFREIVEDNWNDPNDNFAEYSAQLTGGVLPDRGDEYLAVFGFREPNGKKRDFGAPGLLDDTYQDVWKKPKFIRVRATLHDSQFRIPGGREYEFILEISPLEAD